MGQTSLNPPAQLAQSVPATVTAVRAVDNAVQQLLQMPVPPSSGAPRLPGDIAAAKANAGQWQSPIRGVVVSGLQGVADWGTIFDGLFTQLAQLAAQLGQGSTAAIAPFKALLGQLQTKTIHESQLVAQIKPTLDLYNGRLQDNLRNLIGDQQQLQGLVAADQTRVDALIRQIRDLEDKLRNANWWDKFVNIFTHDLDNAQRQLEQVGPQFEQAQNDLGTAQFAQQVTGQYQGATGGVVTGVEALQNGWAVLNSNFTVLLQSEAITDFNVFTPDVLASVKSDWDNLAKQARELGGVT